MPRNLFHIFLIGLALLSVLATARLSLQTSHLFPSLTVLADEVVPSVRIQSLPDHFKP